MIEESKDFIEILRECLKFSDPLNQIEALQKLETKIVSLTSFSTGNGACQVTKD